MSGAILPLPPLILFTLTLRNSVRHITFFMKIQVFWNMTPYILVTSYRRYGGVRCLHLYMVFLKPEGAGSQKIANEHTED